MGGGESGESLKLQSRHDAYYTDIISYLSKGPGVRKVQNPIY